MQGDYCDVCHMSLKRGQFYFNDTETKLCQWHYLEELARREQVAIDAVKRPYANATSHSKGATAPSVVYVIGD